VRNTILAQMRMQKWARRTMNEWVQRAVAAGHSLPPPPHPLHPLQ
jgi:hypothetical protein